MASFVLNQVGIKPGSARNAFSVIIAWEESCSLWQCCSAVLRIDDIAQSIDQFPLFPLILSQLMSLLGPFIKLSRALQEKGLKGTVIQLYTVRNSEKRP